jgi:hypothetical protein
MDITPFVVPGVIAIMSLFLVTLAVVTAITHEPKH